jgi:hypothetical protein
MSDGSIDLVVVFGVVELVQFGRHLRPKRDISSYVWTRVENPLKLGESVSRAFDGTQFQQARYPRRLISLTKCRHISPSTYVDPSMPELVYLARARF